MYSQCMNVDTEMREDVRDHGVKHPYSSAHPRLAASTSLAMRIPPIYCLGAWCSGARAAARARDGHGRGIHGQSTARPVLYTAVRMIFSPPTGRHGSRHGRNGYTAIGQIFS
ncbi:hypothetical protein DFH09DRAFT_1070267 [Mycena vulgaris]|nr:hypothetical protein DFH09DRAFT_1070267 [Mycena vulgaris]